MSAGYVDQTATAESNGDPTARNPRSSATGVGQFIDSTWLDMVGKYRPDLAGLPRDQVLALRNDPDLSKEMIGHYGEENGAKLRAAGLPDNDGTRYLSHFAGPGGARAVLSADPSTPVAQVLQPGQVAANPFIQGMTTGQLTDWAAKKVGGSTPAMTMPGSLAGPGRFGIGGPTQSGAGSTLPAGGAAMQIPAQAETESSPSVSSLLRAMTEPDAAAARSAAQPAAAAKTAAPFGFGMGPQTTKPPAAFDPTAYARLLRSRVTR